MQNVPPFLAPLLEDRPTAHLKLLAAWDGLSVESQIAVLYALRGRDPHLWHNAISCDLALKALGSPNAYVRYMVATGLDHTLVERNIEQDRGSNGTHGQDRSFRTLRERIEADPDPLVRSALLEREGWSDGELAECLRQPLSVRLALLQQADAEKFARIVRQAVSTGVVSESEVAAMIKEWVNHADHLRSLTEERCAGRFPDADIYRTRVFETLWKLVPEVPEVAARILVAKLPATTTNLVADQIPEEVLDRMSPTLLAQLFWRNDVDLEAYRKKIVLTHPLENHGDWLVIAACHRAFDLTHEEFEHLMQSDAKRLAELHFAMHMSPVLLQAAADFFDGKLRMKPPQPRSSDLWYAETKWGFEDTLDHRLQSTDGWGPQRFLRPRRLWELRVYALAKDLASNHDEFSRKYAEALLASDSHRWLRKYVVPGDIWSTYIKLRDAASRDAGWIEVGGELFGRRRDKSDPQVQKWEKRFGRRPDKSDPQVQKWENVLPSWRRYASPRQRARAVATSGTRMRRRLRKLDRRLAVVEELNTRIAIVERVATGAQNLFLLVCSFSVTAHWLGGQSWPAALSNAVIVYLAWIAGVWLLAWLRRALSRLEILASSARERFVAWLRTFMSSTG